MTQYDGVSAAKQLAQDYTDRALTLIQQLPAGSAQQSLEQLTRLLLRRDH
ncbi:Heptaprenyl diphosphate synthase component II [Levilactobacillus brevis]|nr:Heptaprenyl diphosphate synthase component II [Levilactobacillus brevis]